MEELPNLSVGWNLYEVQKDQFGNIHMRSSVVQTNDGLAVSLNHLEEAQKIAKEFNQIGIESSALAIATQPLTKEVLEVKVRVKAGEPVRKLLNHWVKDQQIATIEEIPIVPTGVLGDYVEPEKKDLPPMGGRRSLR